MAAEIEKFTQWLEQEWVTGKAQRAIIGCILLQANHINF